jgi:hypothetical protein
MQFGFALGCEAVAMPRRRGAFTFWAMPLCSFLRITEGQSPREGHGRQ